MIELSYDTIYAKLAIKLLHVRGWQTSSSCIFRANSNKSKNKPSCRRSCVHKRTGQRNPFKKQPHATVEYSSMILIVAVETQKDAYRV